MYLAAVAVFFAAPPDTSQWLIVSNSMKYGLRRSLSLSMTGLNRISGGLMMRAAVLLGIKDVAPVQ